MTQSFWTFSLDTDGNGEERCSFLFSSEDAAKAAAETAANAGVLDWESQASYRINHTDADVWLGSPPDPESLVLVRVWQLALVTD